MLVYCCMVASLSSMWFMMGVSCLRICPLMNCTPHCAASLHHCALHCKRTLDTTNEKFSIQCFALFLSPFTDHTLQANPHASCFHEFILILGFHKCLVFTKIFHIGSVTAPLCTPLQEDPRHDKWEIFDSMLRSLPFSLHRSYVAGKSPR